MKSLHKLFLENKAWVVERQHVNPGYFIEMAKDQKPSYLWIGCSDSRILPNEITGTSIGDMFVHRNIANLVHSDDLNLMSVVTYALKYLQIKHVIVCGHYGCGGVKAALSDQSFGLIDGWLKNIKQVVSSYKDELNKLPGEDERFSRLVELNVVEQVRELQESPVMKDLMRENPGIDIHGWVYDLKTGYLKDVLNV